MASGPLEAPAQHRTPGSEMVGEWIGFVIVVSFGAWLVARAWTKHPAQGVSFPRALGVAVPSPAESADGTGWLLRLAVNGLVGSVAAAVLYAWASVFPQLASAGLTAMVFFLLPIVVGFIHQALRRAPDRLGS